MVSIGGAVRRARSVSAVVLDEITQVVLAYGSAVLVYAVLTSVIGFVINNFDPMCLGVIPIKLGVVTCVMFLPWILAYLVSIFLARAWPFLWERVACLFWVLAASLGSFGVLSYVAQWSDDGAENYFSAWWPDGFVQIFAWSWFGALGGFVYWVVVRGRVRADDS